jgi:L-ascorbate metabolism protein UlaG (beta-lactamase superfamily)
MPRMYLRPNYRLEPLVNRWYAWPMLIAPAPFAMVTKNLHVRILESYVAAPALHRAAVRNPALRGGPYLDYDGDVEKVRDFLNATKSTLRNALLFAAAITQFGQQLREEADGYSLEQWYARIPDPLKGLVELGYDLDHNPSLRFFEGLLYRSPYYDERLQSIAILQGDNDKRPFVLSTPRLTAPGQVQLQLPFREQWVDVLARARTDGIEQRTCDELISLCCDSDREAFREAFWPQPPVREAQRTYQGEGVRVRYLGHATLLLECQGVAIMTDPIVSYPASSHSAIARIDFAALPDRIDYVLLTHSHQDHVLFETLLQLRHKIGTVVVPRNLPGALQDPALRLVLRALNFASVLELSEMESVEFPGGRITGVPFLGEHGDLHIHSKLAYHIQSGAATFLCVADSNNLDDEMYGHVHRTLGDIDHIFIGMECEGAPMSWLYGPLLDRPLDRDKDQSRRLNGSDYARAVHLIQRFNPKSVYVYAMGQEPWLGYVSSIVYTKNSKPIVESDRLVRECRSRGIAAERLYGAKTLTAKG